MSRVCFEAIAFAIVLVIALDITYTYNGLLFWWWLAVGIVRDTATGAGARATVRNAFKTHFPAARTLWGSSWLSSWLSSFPEISHLQYRCRGNGTAAYKAGHAASPCTCFVLPKHTYTWKPIRACYGLTPCHSSHCAKLLVLLRSL